MNKKEPWHDVPSCEICPEESGPVVIAEGGGFRCAACGHHADLSEADEKRCRKADTAWDLEIERQMEEEKQQREHDRKVPLLKEAVARRKRMMA